MTSDCSDTQTSWSIAEGPNLADLKSQMRNCESLPYFNGKFTRPENSACFIINQHGGRSSSNSEKRNHAYSSYAVPLQLNFPLLQVVDY